LRRVNVLGRIMNTRNTLFYASFTFSAPQFTSDDNEDKPEEPVNAHETGSPIIDSRHEEGMSRSLIFFVRSEFALFCFPIQLFLVVMLGLTRIQMLGMKDYK
jgi:hypothetical protein